MISDTHFARWFVGITACALRAENGVWESWFVGESGPTDIKSVRRLGERELQFIIYRAVIADLAANPGREYKACRELYCSPERVDLAFFRKDDSWGPSPGVPYALVEIKSGEQVEESKSDENKLLEIRREAHLKCRLFLLTLAYGNAVKLDALPGPSPNRMVDRIKLLKEHGQEMRVSLLEVGVAGKATAGR